MNDAYRLAFYDVVKETQATTGYDLPEHMEAYVVMLLAEFLDRPDFLPEKTFAESYLKLQSPGGISAKQLGDTCLFVTGVFPRYGRKYGISRTYYQSIGSSSYEEVAQVLNTDLFTELSLHFNFLSDFIELTCHSSYSSSNRLSS